MICGTCCLVGEIHLKHLPELGIRFGDLGGICWANILRQIDPEVLLSCLIIPHIHNWGPDFSKTDQPWLRFKHLWRCATLSGLHFLDYLSLNDEPFTACHWSSVSHNISSRHHYKLAITSQFHCLCMHDFLHISQMLRSLDLEWHSVLLGHFPGYH